MNAQEAYNIGRITRARLLKAGHLRPLEARGYATLAEWLDRISSATGFATGFQDPGVFREPEPMLALDARGKRIARKRIAGYHESGPDWEDESGDEASN